MPTCYPCDLKVDKVTSTSLVFSFSKVDCEELNGPLTGYEYKVTRDDKESVFKLDPEETTCTCMLNMKGITTCFVSVAAINEAGVGKHCPPVNVPLDSITEECHKKAKLEQGRLSASTQSSTKPTIKQATNEMTVSIKITGKL